MKAEGVLVRGPSLEFKQRVANILDTSDLYRKLPIK